MSEYHKVELTKDGLTLDGQVVKGIVKYTLTEGLDEFLTLKLELIVSTAWNQTD